MEWDVGGRHPIYQLLYTMLHFGEFYLNNIYLFYIFTKICMLTLVPTCSREDHQFLFVGKESAQLLNVLLACAGVPRNKCQIGALPSPPRPAQLQAAPFFRHHATDLRTGKGDGNDKYVNLFKIRYTLGF